MQSPKRASPPSWMTTSSRFSWICPPLLTRLACCLFPPLMQVCGCLLLLQRVLDSILTLPNFRLLPSGGLAWTFPMVHAAHCALTLPWIHLAIMLLPAKEVVMWFPATTNCVIILAESCRQAHQVEMGNNFTNHSHTRPAELLVPNWVLGKPAAFDLSVTSPLNPLQLFWKQV